MIKSMPPKKIAFISRPYSQKSLEDEYGFKLKPGERFVDIDSSPLTPDEKLLREEYYYGKLDPAVKFPGDMKLMITLWHDPTRGEVFRYSGYSTYPGQTKNIENLSPIWNAEPDLPKFICGQDRMGELAVVGRILRAVPKAEETKVLPSVEKKTYEELMKDFEDD